MSTQTGAPRGETPPRSEPFHWLDLALLAFSFVILLVAAQIAITGSAQTSTVANLTSAAVALGLFVVALVVLGIEFYRVRHRAAAADDHRKASRAAAQANADGRDGLTQIDGVALLFAFVILVMATGLAVYAGTQTDFSKAASGIAAIGLLIVAFVALGIVVYRVRQRSANPSGIKSRPGLIDYAVLAGLPFLVLIAGVITYWLINRNQQSGPNVLPDQLAVTFFLTFSVMALLLALSMTAIFFSWAQLADQRQALGLPEGSVRAVIALALIIIFAIAAVFLYSHVAQSNTFTVTGLTQADVDSIPATERLQVTAETLTTPTPLPDGTVPAAGPQTYTVVRLDPAQSHGDELAQQIITTVSTLVVAVSAFYFGTSSVKSAVDAVGGGAAAGRSIRVTSPNTDATRKLRTADGKTWTAPPITVETTPPNLAVKGEIVSGDPASDIALFQNQPGQFKYLPSKPDNQVLLRFSLAADANVNDTVLLSKLMDTTPAPDASTDASGTDEQDDGDGVPGTDSGGGGNGSGGAGAGTVATDSGTDAAATPKAADVATGASVATTAAGTADAAAARRRRRRARADDPDLAGVSDALPAGADTPKTNVPVPDEGDGTDADVVGADTEAAQADATPAPDTAVPGSPATPAVTPASTAPAAPAGAVPAAALDTAAAAPTTGAAAPPQPAPASPQPRRSLKAPQLEAEEPGTSSAEMEQRIRDESSSGEPPDRNWFTS